MKTISRGVLGASLIIGGLCAASTASAQPSDVKIQNFTHAGTGCPANSVATVVTQRKDAILIAFDKFIAQTVPPSNIARANCNLTIDLVFDPAWSVTVFQVDYRGFAGLEDGVIGEQKSSYYFLGQPIRPEASAKTSLKGPIFDNYARSDDVGLFVWSECGGSEHVLNINAEVRVSGKQGLMTLDTVTGKVVQVYDLRWKKCP